MRVQRWLVITLACGVAACSPSGRGDAASPRLPVISLPAELDRVLRDYERDWRGGDARSLSQLFTEDGMVIAAGRNAIRGRGAIEAFYAGPSGQLTLAPIAFAASDSVGYIIGTFGGPDVASHPGNFILALRRSPEGRWLIAADMAGTAR